MTHPIARGLLGGGGRRGGRGEGIPAEHREHIFDKFIQIEPGTWGGGTGLGLAIFQDIVERHDGHIEAVAPPGERATFTLPLAIQRRAEATRG